MPAQAMLEQTFLYFPTRAIEATPADAGLTYEEVFFAGTAYWETWRHFLAQLPASGD